MKQYVWSLTYTIVLLLASVSMNAQTAIVSGKVLDADGGSTLPGANVFLKANTGYGTITDIDGNFNLTGVPVGEQVIVVSYLGYETKEVTVQLEQGERSVIDVNLSPSSIMGQEVVVSAQLLGQAKAINQQLNSESIANIVSADRIQELPDVNAAEAIARLPGVSVNRSGGEGQKVVIRGVEPKFNAITVNGVRLPSNSSTDRSVDLSLISPELLDGIEVFKSPLPDMDAEAIGGTVNLKLRKAPKDFRLLTRAFGGYNNLNNYYGDYKGLVQVSDRIFKDKLGFVAQGNVERFNRGGDYLSNSWTQGRTNPETGITDILGNTLRFEDRDEIRERRNGSLNLDYDLGKSNIALFGLYSRTERDQFRVTNTYSPGAPGIFYTGQSIDNQLDLYSVALSGQHNLNKVIIDWNISTATTEGATPQNITMEITDNEISYDSDLDRNGHPRTFFGAANPDLQSAFLNELDTRDTRTFENSQTYFVNFKIPLKLGDKIGGYFKFGGKYFDINRERDVSRRLENFYYLGGATTANASAAYREATGGDELIFSSANAQLISIQNFVATGSTIDFENQDGSQIAFDAALDQDKILQFFETQKPLLNNDRRVLVDNYEVEESITAGYAMFRLDFGDKLTVIPGFRYEYSNNNYSAVISAINGRFGVNGFAFDTVTTQTYGEFLPHLHLKYKPLKWLDVRASYSTTLARPDFEFITPRAQINDSNTSISAGNPNLDYARSQNYDLFISTFKGGLGLFTFGGFYKQISNIFIPWTIQLADPELAAASGWPDYSGYQLSSYTNLENSAVWGYEFDLQTNLSFLPKPFNGFVFNINYARLYSETEFFFLTSESRVIIPFPPVIETIFTNNRRTVSMPSQSPHIFNMSVGYDFKGFSARISGAFQGTKASSYSTNKDFDRFNLEFWRWDASVKQKINKNWTAFWNFNNISNQQDISFTRNQNYINTIQTFGWTSTVGLQFRLQE
ncbi:MAG TPA: TonB-dependent receptor [Saprospiraceae bacterium]|nr:TonB-dependent receptor [Saprospiraceae bacterium]